MKTGSNNGVQGTLHKVSGPLTPDVRHKEMNILRITAVLVAILAPCACATSFIEIQITTNAEPATYSINDRPVSRMELSKSLALISNIDTKQTIIIEPAPLSSARSLMDMLSELKARGLTNTYVYYRELPSPLASPNYILSFPLNLDALKIGNGPDERAITLPAEEAQEIERLYQDAKQKKAEQGGPGYPPQGVGSPDP